MAKLSGSFGDDSTKMTEELRAEIEKDGTQVLKDRLLSLSHQQALEELIRLAGTDSRIEQVERIEHGLLLGV